MTGARGFSLIELIAVMLLTAILAAAVTPAVSGTAASRQMAAGRQVQRDLTWARQRAMGTGTTHWVVFSISAQTYSVLMENPASPGRAGAATVTDPATGGAMVQRLNSQPYDGVSITGAGFGGGVEVGFDRLGRPIATSGSGLTSNGTVTLTGGQTVTVQAGSGLAVWTHP